MNTRKFFCARYITKSFLIVLILCSREALNAMEGIQKTSQFVENGKGVITKLMSVALIKMNNAGITAIKGVSASFWFVCALVFAVRSIRWFNRSTTIEKKEDEDFEMVANPHDNAQAYDATQESDMHRARIWELCSDSIDKFSYYLTGAVTGGIAATCMSLGYSILKTPYNQYSLLPMIMVITAQTLRALRVGGGTSLLVTGLSSFKIARDFAKYDPSKEVSNYEYSLMDFREMAHANLGGCLTAILGMGCCYGSYQLLEPFLGSLKTLDFLRREC